MLCLCKINRLKKHCVRQYCWWWKGIHLARLYCWLQKWRSKRKHKRVDIEAYFRNKTKTFWFGPLIIRTKAERFNLFQNYLKSNRNILAFFKVQKRNQNEIELISYWIKTFPYTYAPKETKRNFCELFPNFVLVRNVFVCFKLLRNQNRTLIFSKNDIKTKPKRYKLRQGFF